MDIKEDSLHSDNQETSLIMKDSIEENIMINQSMISEGLHLKEHHSLPGTSFTPRYINLFYDHCFYCTNFVHKVADCRAYERNT